MSVNKPKIRLLKSTNTYRFSNKASNLNYESTNSSTESKPWYRFPLGLFLVFSNLKLIVWTSVEDTKFDYYIAVPNESVFDIVLYIKKHIFGNQSYVLDLTTYAPCNNLPANAVSYKEGLYINIISVYLYHSRLRLHLVSLADCNYPLKSLDSIYKNMNWLERESSEMYGLSNYSKGDSRKLLLNYFDNNAPMRKSYNSSASYEVYYDFLDAQVQYISGIRSEI